LPTYQYTCTECGEPVEAVQKFSDPPLTVCEACGGKLRKVFSPVGIVFKGSGFYRTDSRKASSASDTAKDTKTSNGDSSSSAAKSDSTSSSSSASDSKPSTPAPAKPASSGEKVA
jgi:putative FmdB family regulatory protein